MCLALYDVSKPSFQKDVTLHFAKWFIHLYPRSTVSHWRHSSVTLEAAGAAEGQVGEAHVAPTSPSTFLLPDPSGVPGSVPPTRGAGQRSWLLSPHTSSSPSACPVSSMFQTYPESDTSHLPNRHSALLAAWPPEDPSAHTLVSGSEPSAAPESFHV